MTAHPVARHLALSRGRDRRRRHRGTARAVPRDDAWLHRRGAGDALRRHAHERSHVARTRQDPRSRRTGARRPARGRILEPSSRRPDDRWRQTTTLRAASRHRPPCRRSRSRRCPVRSARGPSSLGSRRCSELLSRARAALADGDAGKARAVIERARDRSLSDADAATSSCWRQTPGWSAAVPRRPSRPTGACFDDGRARPRARWRRSPSDSCSPNAARGSRRRRPSTIIWRTIPTDGSCGRRASGWRSFNQRSDPMKAVCLVVALGVASCGCTETTELIAAPPVCVAPGPHRAPRRHGEFDLRGRGGQRRRPLCAVHLQRSRP